MTTIAQTSPYIYYMAKIIKNYTELINKELEEYNIYFGDIPYLYCLTEHNNTTQENIAKILGYNDATVTRALKRLEKKEFITKTTYPTDKRKKIIQITQQGEKATQIIKNKQEQIEKEIMLDLTDTQKETTKEVLKVFLEKLEQKNK